jgi:PIN domain nuclease of toxin-antitoxin system
VNADRRCIILDACALLAFLRKEPGWDVVHACLTDAACTNLIHAVNLCEVYYDTIRKSGLRAANQVMDDVLALPISTREDLDPAFWQAVGHLKSSGRISLADCFAIALAQRERAMVLTSDRREFERIAAAGVCDITFIR